MAESLPEGPALYPGEVFDTIAGFPTIYHYQPPAGGKEASSNNNEPKPKPLIVCVTGGLHLARIFYGGHRGSRPDDFLAFWLSKLGFGVLSLSYPLETDPPIMPTTAAHFRIGDWGRQAALTAKKVLEENATALETRSVVLIAWSMAGRMVVPFNISATEQGLHVQQFISFSATPGFSSIRLLPPGMTPTPVGYFHLMPHIEVFCQQLDEMKNLYNSRKRDGDGDDGDSGGGEGDGDIIPRDVYLREYIGATPINLIGLRLLYDRRNKGFVRDDVPHEEDSRVLDVANFPLISCLYPISILDASHALADKASWGFLLTYKLETMIGKQGLLNVQGTPKWRQLLDLVHSAPEKLLLPATGNHFFFVGHHCARETADRVAGLLDEGTALRKLLSDLTGTSSQA
ncbi:hypothetical protein A1O3_03419 [Capronia epimyces CBS 606.96]|uniref:AB hydrolase-1 domain-containing protein n=1 Tax=Capronia epimyces CBS 606.96 TaxID=1182542 RepID=W9Y1V8_9EURO|nr:uncharacterized protein A1O3_03419 [Capronia epimyces CBS 606.96]EXJ86468.1 hypothetical protein A1O3_03419 [Capronia epimyces CBS 606.96]